MKVGKYNVNIATICAIEDPYELTFGKHTEFTFRVILNATTIFVSFKTRHEAEMSHKYLTKMWEAQCQNN